jgi:cation transport ATPase
MASALTVAAFTWNPAAAAALSRAERCCHGHLLVAEHLRRPAHAEGHALLLVSRDPEVAGAIELHVTVRPEARRIVQSLRERGIGSLYIISGDHVIPTGGLAAALGIDRYFAGGQGGPDRGAQARGQGRGQPVLSRPRRR